MSRLKISCLIIIIIVILGQMWKNIAQLQSETHMFILIALLEHQFSRLKPLR